MPTPLPSDADLARLSQAGDRDAADQLITRHTPAVFRQLGRLKVPPHVDPDELSSAALITLWKCCLAWKPDRGTMFITYAWTAIDNTLRRELGRLSFQRDFTLDNAHQDDEDFTDFFDTLPARPQPEPDVDVRKWVAELPPVSRKVVTLAYGLDGTPAGWGAISAATGLTIPQAKRAVELAVA